MAEKKANPKNAGRKPKFDYTGEEYLNKISELARKGYTDRDIAFTIGLSESTFFEQKAKHSEISEALAHARSQLNTVVRGAFLKAALGGKLTRRYSYVQKRCECGGKDPDCPICDGTGWITPEQHRVVEEIEQAPNLMAQNRWLMNYDADWKKKTRGVDEEEDNTVDGFDIEVTFNKKEDLDLQERVKNTDNNDKNE